MFVSRRFLLFDKIKVLMFSSKISSCGNHSNNMTTKSSANKTQIGKNALSPKQLTTQNIHFSKKLSNGCFRAMPVPLKCNKFLSK